MDSDQSSPVEVDENDIPLSLRVGDSIHNMKWNHIWRQLKEANWSYTRGTGLISWTYHRPSSGDKKITQVLGVHYFNAEIEVMNFIASRSRTLRFSSSPMSSSSSSPQKIRKSKNKDEEDEDESSENYHIAPFSPPEVIANVDENDIPFSLHVGDQIYIMKWRSIWSELKKAKWNSKNNKYFYRPCSNDDKTGRGLSNFDGTTEVRNFIAYHTSSSSSLTSSSPLTSSLSLTSSSLTSSSSAPLGKKRKVTHSRSQHLSPDSHSFFTDYKFFLLEINPQDRFVIKSAIKSNGGTLLKETEFQGVIKQKDIRNLVVLCETTGLRRLNFLSALAAGCNSHSFPLYLSFNSIGVLLIHPKWVLDSVDKYQKMEMMNYLLPTNFTTLSPFITFSVTDSFFSFLLFSSLFLSFLLFSSSCCDIEIGAK